MKFHIYFLGLICIACISSTCSEIKEKADITYFDRTDFGDSVSVVLDTLPVSELILNPVAFYVVRDTLLLVRNAQSSDYMVEIHNLITKELISKTAPSGRGPFEVLGGYVCIRSDSTFFIFHDMVSRRFLIYDFDSLLKYKSTYKPIVQKTPSEAVDIALLKDRGFIYYDSRYFETGKFSNGVDELALEELNSGARYHPKDYNFFVANINGGKIYTSPNHTRIALFARFSDEISIYNDRLDLLKRIKGPDNYVPEFISQKTSLGKTEIRNTNKTRIGYGLGFTDEQYIYSVYKTSNRDRNYTEVFKFDWDGSPVKRYVIDYSINALSISNGYIYATAYETPQSAPKLVRFKK